MARKELKTLWNRKQLDDTNDNFKEIYEGKFLGKGSLNAEVLEKNSVESDKRTVKGEKGFIITPEWNKIPNVDTKDKTFTFYADTIINFQKRNSQNKNIFVISNNQIINLLNDSTTNIITFNTESNEFKSNKFGYNPNENEVILTTGRLNGSRTTFDIGVPYTIDGISNGLGKDSVETTFIKNDAVNSEKRSIKGEKGMFIVPFSSKLPNVNFELKTLTFFADTIVVFQKKNTKNRSHYIISKDLTINLTDSKSTAKIIIFDFIIEEIKIVDYNYNLLENECILGSGRVTDWSVFIDIGIPYKVDDTVFGNLSEEIDFSKMGFLMNSSEKRTTNFFTKEGKRYVEIFTDSIVVTGNKTIPVSFTDENGKYQFQREYQITSSTSATKLIYDTILKDYKVIAYNTKITNKQILLATIRWNSDSFVRISCNFEYNFQGVPYGNFLNSTSNATSSLTNTFDDYIKSGNHRGDSISCPENTFAAYKSSKRKGTSIIEMDLAFTKDNVAVNLHDETINRTARNKDGSKIKETLNISDITFEQARSYEYGSWKSDAFKGEKIPSFEGIVKFIMTLNMHLYIDKCYVLNSDERLNHIFNIIDKYNAIDHITFGDGINAFEKIINKYKTPRLFILSGDINEQKISDVKRFEKLGANVFVFADVTVVKEKSVIDTLNKNINVEFWSCGLNTDYFKWIDLGVTGFQTDGYNFKELMIDKL